MRALYVPVFKKEKEIGRGYRTAAVRSAAPMIALMRHQLDPRKMLDGPAMRNPVHSESIWVYRTNRTRGPGHSSGGSGVGGDRAERGVFER